MRWLGEWSFRLHHEHFWITDAEPMNFGPKHQERRGVVRRRLRQFSVAPSEAQKAEVRTRSTRPMQAGSTRSCAAGARVLR